ncbi:hypothetical protein FC84_GL000187 [Lapidilactobacillus dextrinicus DSM 20335]|uniref:Type I-B CRISPR-associated protein Cas7/Cst2/DevR n=1 Tax=Lapidilactobacillus dextrinicus DSM 20335 TaxID=1423738 RepID=A0A0R2BSV7_9LACO|nr:type I-B CRISPR-associated protein Cas7/Cst2/DevR [Lapidilactobacillus dextrinicus]KRM79030.1 hypothetical protein FC84_GL000187 [Lapidilactobacillus dextrinicus DSM 20335]QFG46056.1 type I-B CRISPR-associated protein Cas7/Cst2/DevR [Lapidilactobacillus dextrinicus]
MMNKKGLTATIIFIAESANYGESLGNIANLKKMTRGNGSQYTYISRQALRYNIVEQLDEPLAKLSQDGDNSKAVIQFDKNASVTDFPELDFFGYLKTAKESSGLKRSAKVRLSNAIALEPYLGDTDFLTNMGLAARLRAEKGNDANNSIAQSQIQRSYYRYTITIDLDQIGIDAVDGTNLDNAEKSRRVQKLLDTIAFLYRDIRGRREDLKPLFIVGGVYDIKNPVFENIVTVDKNSIKVKPILEAEESLPNETFTGVVSDQFDNDEQLKTELKAGTVGSVIKNLKQKVGDYYEGN